MGKKRKARSELCYMIEDIFLLMLDDMLLWIIVLWLMILCLVDDDISHTIMDFYIIWILKWYYGVKWMIFYRFSLCVFSFFYMKFMSSIDFFFMLWIKKYCKTLAANFEYIASAMCYKTPPAICLLYYLPFNTLYIPCLWHTQMAWYRGNHTLVSFMLVHTNQQISNSATICQTSLSGHKP